MTWILEGFAKLWRFLLVFLQFEDDFSCFSRLSRTVLGFLDVFLCFWGDLPVVGGFHFFLNKGN